MTVDGSLAPEALLTTWLGDHFGVVSSVIYGEPFRVPYDRLAGADGWVVWLGHPPIPDALTLLPAPETLLWNEPETAIATGMLVAADYAIRRGATTAEVASAILRRESPVAFVVPEGISGNADRVLEDAKAAGLPVILSKIDSMDSLAADASSFGRRRFAHSVSIDRAHDPALSFQSRVPVLTIGDNAASSFVVHDAPERDGISITGTMSEQFALEIGLAAPDVTPESLADVERLTATIPSFLDGVTSYLEGETLEIGWQVGREPTPEMIAEVIRIWLKALLDATVVDVRIAFAPAGTSSTELGELHRRAATFRAARRRLKMTGA